MPHPQDSLSIGFVTAVYPAGQSIDVLMSEDGSRLSNVQVAVPSGSSKTGLVDLPDPGLPSDNTRWDFNSNPTRYLRALIAYASGQPICTGFLLPQITEVTFDRKNFRVMRHASDVYTTIDDDGNVEFAHPSGVYFRIATNPAHEDLTYQDVDQSWHVARNTAQAVHVHLAALGGTTFDVAPNGAIVINVPTGTVALTAPAGVTVTAPTFFIGNMTITGNVEITGNVGVLGNSQFTGDVDVIGPSTFLGTVDITGNVGIIGNLGVDGAVSFLGGAVTMTANITLNGTLVSSGDVTAGGISLITHPHLHGSYTAGATAVTGLSGLPT